MSAFIVSDWFSVRSKLKIQKYTIEGIEFELMALSDDLITDIKSCETYAEAVDFAADSGLSYSRKRVVDDTELAKDIDMLWQQDAFDIDVDPSVKAQVGEKVCEISGLTFFITELQVSEEDKEIAIVDGDNLPDSDVTLAQLEADARAHLTHN